MRPVRSFFWKQAAAAALFLALALAAPAGAADGASGDVRMTLAQAIGTALAHNEDVQESFRRISAAEASALVTRGAYDLNVFSAGRYGSFTSLSAADYSPAQLTNASKSYGRVDTGLRQHVATGGSLSLYNTFSHENMLGTSGLPRNLEKNYVTIELAQSLLRNIGDKENQGAIEKAVLAVQDSQEARDLVVSQVVLAVIRAYWLLDNACNNAEVARQILGMAREVQRREVVRFDQGLSQGVDVERANQAVKQREYVVLQYERDMAVAQEQLALLLNYPGYSRETTIIPASTPNGDVAPLPDEGESIAAALKDRYELKQLAILLKQLNVEYDVNRNKLLPTLDATVGATTSNGNDYLKGGDNFKDTGEKASWFVGLSFSYPLQSREARGNVTRTEELIRISKDRISMTERSIQTEVREALHNLVLARSGLPVARAAREAAVMTKEGEEKRFELGGVNNRDLLTSQDALGREEITLYTAVVNYNIALAQYNYACSRLLDKCRVTVGDKEASIQ